MMYRIFDGLFANEEKIMTKKTMHVPSLVLGIIALATTWVTIGISGIVCGVIGINLSKKAKHEYRTTAGFVLSVIAVVVSAILLVVLAMMLLVVFLMPNSVGASFIRDVVWFL